jgi:hypothetical protein
LFADEFGVSVGAESGCLCKEFITRMVESNRSHTRRSAAPKIIKTRLSASSHPCGKYKTAETHPQSRGEIADSLIELKTGDGAIGAFEIQIGAIRRLPSIRPQTGNERGIRRCAFQRLSCLRVE